MKKTILLLALVLSTLFLFSQSQRMVFIEEFTQASCGPCAAANPAFNSLLSANTSKAISLKYQASFPGTDPMFNQNSAEILKCEDYYAISNVPNARIDGNGVNGAPSVITQANINAEYAVPSAFSINLNHWFNAANDSIYINCEITCTQNISVPTPRVRIAMIEKTISFSSPPGNNGEKIFHNVMRKMYPGTNGTALASSWIVGQKKTISFKEKIPTYIYSKPQIAVVAWIQDESNKNVKQAQLSSTVSPLSLAPVADFLANTSSACDGIIKFKDQSALFPTSWLWNFGDGQISTLKNPTHKYNSNGSYAVQLSATNTNGTNSITKTALINISLSGTAPTGVNDNICSSGVASLAATATGAGTLNWYDNTGNIVHTGNTYSPTITGTTDFWVAEMTPNSVLSVGPTTNGFGAGSTYTPQATQGLFFNVIKSCTLVSVVVYASTAGNRTIQILDADGTVIRTATVNIPSGQSTVNLNFALDPGNSYLIQPSTLACNLYRNTAGAVYPYSAGGVIGITGNTISSTSPGNYYFFYDWKVQQSPCTSPGVKVSGIDSCSSTGINDVRVINSFIVYPNPSKGLITVLFNAATIDNYNVKLTNTLGQVVYEEQISNFSGEYSKQVDISAYGNGIYLFSVSSSKAEGVKKILILK